MFSPVSRFALAHLHGKCRREVVLAYFKEDIPPEKPTECCDVCCQLDSAEKIDVQGEVVAIIRAVQDMPNKGEQKVRRNTYTCTLIGRKLPSIF